MIQKHSITVVIPCHNYTRYLTECIDSVKAAGVTNILVVDDASTDDPETVAKVSEVKYLRTEHNNLNKVRWAGMGQVNTKYVAFIDADNKVHPSYFDWAIGFMESHRNVAFVFPVLDGFGESEGPQNGTGDAPVLATARTIEDANYCDGNSVWRSEVLLQCLAFNLSLPADIATHDWRMARTVLRSGWYAYRNEVPLLYRRHLMQMSRRAGQVPYHHDASLLSERVTIVVAFSGRRECWKRVREWLVSQTFQNTRLLIMNGSHSDLSPSDFGLSDWNRSLTIERYDAGTPKLADENRQKQVSVRASVEAAVAGIYNRAVQMAAPDEYLFFLEDDVVPDSFEAIAEMIAMMQPHTFAISGLYQHRYHQKACAFTVPISSESLLPLDGPEFEQVDGTGFGCLLARRSVLLSHMLSGDDATNPHYDCDLAARLKSTKWKWFLARSIRCQHLIGLH